MPGAFDSACRCSVLALVVACGSSHATAASGASASGSTGSTASGAPTGAGGPSGASTGSSGAGASASGAGGASVADRFPATAILYQDVSTATPDPTSAAVINHLQSVGWGSGRFQIDFSLTILHADASIVPRPFTQAAGYYSPDCDLTPVPVPPGGNAEGSNDYSCDTSQGDCHVLVYQGARLYELYNTSIAGGLATGSPFTTLCEVAWDLTRDYWSPGATAGTYGRGEQCTSADAAGMPIAPLLVTGAELAAGVVPHALRFILPNADIRKGVYVHPGTHLGAPSGDALMPPYAARFRLKSSFDLSQLNPAARAVAVAMQTYGMFLDDGGNIPLTVDASAASALGSHDLASLQVSDFDMIPSPDPPVTATDDCMRTPVTR
jgi:serine/threonine-protein kinase